MAKLTASGPRIDSALVKALARAHRWQRLLESGECASITELAAAEKINRSYVCRVLRLTLLAPEIVEAILDGRQPEEVILPALMKPFPVAWRAGAISEAALCADPVAGRLLCPLNSPSFERERKTRARHGR